MRWRAKIAFGVLVGILVALVHFCLYFWAELHYGFGGSLSTSTIRVLDMFIWPYPFVGSSFYMYQPHMALIWGLICGVAAFMSVAFIRSSYPPGHCRRCGYSLRGSDGRSPCPECGWNRIN